MKMPHLEQLRELPRAVLCAVALAAGCMGRIGPGASPGSRATGAGGMTTVGGTGGTVDPNVIVVNPPPFEAAPRPVAAPDPDTVPERHEGRLQVRGRHQQRSTPTAGTPTSRSIGASVVVTSDQGAEQYNTAIEGAVNLVFNGSATTRSQFIGCTPTGQEQRHLLARLHSEAGASRLAPAAHQRRARWIRDARRQCLDDTGQRGRGGAAGRPWRCSSRRTSSIDRSLAPRLRAVAFASRATRRRTRLAFLIWNSLPDQTLLDQAASGAAGDG